MTGWGFTEYRKVLQFRHAAYWFRPDAAFLLGARVSEGIKVSVRSNAARVALELAAAGQEMRDRAVVRALNKMADQVKTAASREIRSAGYKLKASDIKAALKVRRASGSQKTAAVIASGRPLPLVKYSARQTSKGVTVDVLKGRKLIAGAFIATMPNGHRGVYVREQASKHRKVQQRGKPVWSQLPIRQLFGPAIPDGMANSAVQSALLQLVEEKFPSILEHEHEWLRRRAAKGSR